jgi:hypothetical protein
MLVNVPRILHVSSAGCGGCAPLSEEGICRRCQREAPAAAAALCMSCSTCTSGTGVSGSIPGEGSEQLVAGGSVSELAYIRQAYLVVGDIRMRAATSLHAAVTSRWPTGAMSDANAVLLTGLSIAAAELSKAALVKRGADNAAENDNTATDPSAALPSTVKPPKGKGSVPHQYQRLLFDTVAGPLLEQPAKAAAGRTTAAEADAALQGMPWMLSTYCSSLHGPNRQAAPQGGKVSPIYAAHCVV